MSEHDLEEGEEENKISIPRRSKSKRKKKAPSQQSGGKLETLKQLGQTKLPKNINDDIHCINIVGQIEGHRSLPPKNKTTKYEHLIPQLVAVEQNPKVKGVIITLNTVGGDIEAGLAISEMLSSLSKPTVSLVLGGGHSIGGPVAVATDKSFIAETATMTIHPIRLTGKVIGVPQTYDYLDKMQDRVINFVSRHSDISNEEFRNLMFRTGELVRDIGTVLIGEEAVEEGIIDKVGGLSQAINSLKEMMDTEDDSKDSQLNTEDGKEEIATEAIEVVRETTLM